MNNIKKWFKDDALDNGTKYEFSEYEGHFEARTDTIFFMIVAPHSGTNYRWLLRVAAISSFDRWANSTAVEEFFKTDIDLCDYLNTCQLDIYKAVLKSISEDYEELYKTYEDSEL